MTLTPSSIEEAVALRQAGGRYAAGRTVLRPGAVPDDGLIDLSRLPGLDRVDQDPDGRLLRIGALVTLERLRRDARVQARNPALAELLAYVAGLGVRTLATLGGNIAWGSGDLLPLLLALDARLETSAGDHDAISLPADALLLAVRLPAQPPICLVEKAGFRAAFSPTLITVALGAEIAGHGLTGVRIAAGGGVTRPQRLRRAEAMLEGAPLAGFDGRRLAETIEGDLETVCDPFASAAHRRTVAAQVIAGRLAEEFARIEA